MTCCLRYDSPLSLSSLSISELSNCLYTSCPWAEGDLTMTTWLQRCSSSRILLSSIRNWRLISRLLFLAARLSFTDWMQPIAITTAPDSTRTCTTSAHGDPLASRWRLNSFHRGLVAAATNDAAGNVNWSSLFLSLSLFLLSSPRRLANNKLDLTPAFDSKLCSSHCSSLHKFKELHQA